MLRGDEMDIELPELELFLPERLGVPFELKTKTTKTL